MCLYWGNGYLLKEAKIAAYKTASSHFVIWKWGQVCQKKHKSTLNAMGIGMEHLRSMYGKI